MFFNFGQKFVEILLSILGKRKSSVMNFNLDVHIATVSLQIKDQFGEEEKNNLKTVITDVFLFK